MIPGDSGGFFCSKGWEHEHVRCEFCHQFAEAKMDLNDPGVPTLWGFERNLRTLEWCKNVKGTIDSSAVNLWLEDV